MIEGALAGRRSSDADIESLLQEKRVFKPSAEFAKQRELVAQAGRRRCARSARATRSASGRRWRSENVSWFKPWKKVLDWKPPFAKWFVGGKLNVSYNCLDRHLEGEHAWRRNKAAIIWEGEPGDTRMLTYGELHREVCRFANALKALGVGKGDRVAIYMPMIPELAIAMLACARIGAPHTVVFGGFSAEALRDRINDAGAKLVITADGGWRRGAAFRSRPPSTRRWRRAPSVDARGRRAPHRRADRDARAGRDVWWHDADARSATRLQARRAARHRAPAVHALHERHHRQAEGHPAHHRRLPHARRDHREGDLRPQGRRHLLVHGRLGWVTGHTYVVYGPLANGATDAHVRGRADPSRSPTASGTSSSATASRSSTPRRRRSARSSGWATSTRTSTTSRRCGCSARSASRSTPRRGCGTTA